MRRRQPQRCSGTPLAVAVALILVAPDLAGEGETALAAPEKKAARQGPLSPAESLRRFTVADDLRIELLLVEPTIAQPVFLNFDERGRMWVVEYRQYPEPAGLTMLSRDSVWRIVYDKIPPPPAGVRGRDRITIHEDSDGDGTLDKHTFFVDGLDIATADGRALSGVLIDQDPQVVVLRASEARDVIVLRDQLEEMKPYQASLMPEGLLKGLSDKETRDLLAYLHTTLPPK